MNVKENESVLKDVQLYYIGVDAYRFGIRVQPLRGVVYAGGICPGLDDVSFKETDMPLFYEREEDARMAMNYLLQCIENSGVSGYDIDTYIVRIDVNKNEASSLKIYNK